MPKLRTKKILATEPQFLAIPDHYVNLVGKIAYANLDGLAKVNANLYPDEKIIQRGTLVHMDGAGVVTKPTADNAPNAIIFNTIKVNDYDTSDDFVNATVLVHGFVRKDRLISADAVNGTAEKLSNALIYLMNE